jgi:hypothetical protein
VCLGSVISVWLILGFELQFRELDLSVCRGLDLSARGK